jgi:hypothetical protein
VAAFYQRVKSPPEWVRKWFQFCCEQMFYLLCRKWELLLGIECVSLVAETRPCGWATRVTQFYGSVHSPTELPVAKMRRALFRWMICRCNVQARGWTSVCDVTATHVLWVTLHVCLWLQWDRHTVVRGKACNQQCGQQIKFKKVIYIYIYIIYEIIPYKQLFFAPAFNDFLLDSE